MSLHDWEPTSADPPFFGLNRETPALRLSPDLVFPWNSLTLWEKIKRILGCG